MTKHGEFATRNGRDTNRDARWVRVSLQRGHASRLRPRKLRTITRSVRSRSYRLRESEPKFCWFKFIPLFTHSFVLFHFTRLEQRSSIPEVSVVASYNNASAACTMTTTCTLRSVVQVVLPDNDHELRAIMFYPESCMLKHPLFPI